MFSPTFLFCILVLFLSRTVNTKQCPDCVSISSCEEALTAVTSLQNGERHALYRIKNAICNFKGFDAQVCCSHFSKIDDPIENHPNLPLLPESCGKISSDRIIGSTNTKLYEFPWMALISFRTRDGLEFKCAGTVINSRYILTAGHCVYASEKVAGVRIGEFDISTIYDCQNYMDEFVCESNIQDMKVEKIIIHEAFNNTVSSQHDIALIRLDTPIDLTQKNAAPICLPLSNNERDVILEDKVATVAGWGSMGSGPRSNRLWKVEVIVKLEDVCLKYSANMRKVICAKNRDVCRGDGGGPLMVEGTHKGVYRYIQYGIISYGLNICQEISVVPEVYTDVTKFVQWILDNIEE